MTNATTLSNLRTQEKKEPNLTTQLNKYMEKVKGQMALALPNHLSVDRMARLALSAFSTSKKLQECTFESIAVSVMTASQLGLEIGVNGAGFLVPYKETCTFIPGWKGLVDLVSRSGRGTVFTGVIFRDQEYTFLDGARRDLIIHNETELDDPLDITHAYAVGWVKDSTIPVIELWRVSKIEKHRDKHNKVGKNHYSYSNWEMYARKVPLLQVLKYMPCSIEVANAIAVSDAAEQGRGVTIEGGIVVTDSNENQPQEQPALPHEPLETLNTLTGEILQSEVVTTPQQHSQTKAPSSAATQPLNDDPLGELNLE